MPGQFPGDEPDPGHAAPSGEQMRERPPRETGVPPGTRVNAPDDAPERDVIFSGGLDDEHYWIGGCEGLDKGEDRLGQRLARRPRIDDVEHEDIIAQRAELTALDLGDRPGDVRHEVE